MYLGCRSSRRCCCPCASPSKSLRSKRRTPPRRLAPRTIACYWYVYPENRILNWPVFIQLPGLFNDLELLDGDVFCACPGLEFRGQCAHDRKLKTLLTAGKALPRSHEALGETSGVARMALDTGLDQKPPAAAIGPKRGQGAETGRGRA